MKSSAIQRRQSAAGGLYCAAALLLLAATGGCHSFPLTVPGLNADPPDKNPAAGTQVRASGDGFVLGDVEKSAISPQQFVDRLAELRRAGRAGAAVRWVQLYPDVAAAVLHEPSPAQAAPELLQVIAQAHGRQCSLAPAAENWTALCRDRAANPQRYAPYDQKRHEFLALVQGGRAPEALKLGLAPPPGAPGAMLAIDTQYLTGVAFLLSDRFREAADSLLRAAQQAQAADPYQAAGLLLLLSDAQRRAGQTGSAEATWQGAAQLAAELAAAHVPVNDPILWERIAYLRPANNAWPPAVEQRMTELNGRFGIVLPARANALTPSAGDSSLAEAALWINIGHWRLARTEFQAALVALKRAESMTSDPTAAGQLELSQAKALLGLGQAPAAMGLLVRLTENPNDRVSLAAMAMLGTLKLEQGATQQGFNLLHRALEVEQGAMWFGHTEAEADLGLAYLMCGQENSGLTWLHNAQQGFQSAGQTDQLVQSLENEAAYLEQVKKSDLAKAIRDRLASLQAE